MVNVSEREIQAVQVCGFLCSNKELYLLILMSQPSSPTLPSNKNIYLTSQGSCSTLNGNLADFFFFKSSGLHSQCFLFIKKEEKAGSLDLRPKLTVIKNGERWESKSSSNAKLQLAWNLWLQPLPRKHPIWLQSNKLSAARFHSIKGCKTCFAVKNM